MDRRSNKPSISNPEDYETLEEYARALERKAEEEFRGLDIETWNNYWSQVEAAPWSDTEKGEEE